MEPLCFSLILFISLRYDHYLDSEFSFPFFVLSSSRHSCISKQYIVYFSNFWIYMLIHVVNLFHYCITCPCINMSHYSFPCQWKLRLFACFSAKINKTLLFQWNAHHMSAIALDSGDSSMNKRGKNKSLLLINLNSGWKKQTKSNYVIC